MVAARDAMQGATGISDDIWKARFEAINAANVTQVIPYTCVVARAQRALLQVMWYRNHWRAFGEQSPHIGLTRRGRLTACLVRRLTCGTYAARNQHRFLASGTSSARGRTKRGAEGRWVCYARES